MQTSKIILLSHSFKQRLSQLLDNDGESVIRNPHTDINFLHLIQQYLITSNNLSNYEIYLATRDDLISKDDGLYVKEPQHIILSDRNNVGYPSPLSPEDRMEKYMGIIQSNPFDVKRIISTSSTASTIFVDKTSTMIFDLSDNHPATCTHHDQYRHLVQLFHWGRVQTNPYFILKSECEKHYEFSSSKDIPYVLCKDSNIIIPGVITSDVHIGLTFLKKYKSVVLKHHDGTGGNGISFFTSNSRVLDEGKKFEELFHSMLEKQAVEDELIGVSPRGLVIQKLLPGIEKYGDTRVHLINGKVCLIAQRRLPQDNSLLCNIYAGGSFNMVLLDDAEIAVCVEFAKRVEKYLPSIGSSHIGIDLLKDNDGSKPLISEINTWSISFLAETFDFFECYHYNEKSMALYTEYQEALKRCENEEFSRYVLQSENIPAEVVGKYVKSILI